MTLTTRQIDYDQLAKLVGMTNPRSASNAWAKIKAKLMVDNPEGAASPAKPKATPKKKAAKKGVNGEANGDDGGDVPETPKKTPRKRAPKKQEVDGEAGSPSPKKKGRPAKAKKSESVVGKSLHSLLSVNCANCFAADTDADADAAIKVEANGMFDEDSPKEDNAAADAIDETPDEV